MQIIKIYPRGFAANAYFVTEDGVRAVCIDPAQTRVLDEAEKRGLRVEYVLLTHGHFDHIGGCAALQRAGAKIGCSAAEKPLALGKDNMAEAFGLGAVPPFRVDFTFNGGDTLDLCGVSFRVIATPGHTAGGVCLLAGKNLFTGDTLFAGDAGRTDLPTGSGAQLAASLKKLFALEGDYTVFAGHGEDTSLNREREANGWRV